MLGHKQYLSMKTFRVERDNASIKHELEEIKVVSDEVLRAKVILMFLRNECLCFCSWGFLSFYF